jgi:DNA-binding NarL/FixJ family response regulator
MRVVIADHHRLIREGLRALLEHAGVEVVGEAGDGREAVVEARRLHPDVVVMDVALPNFNGVEATRRITAELSPIRVVGLSGNADRRCVVSMLRAGAAGYLLTSGTSKELVGALEAVGRGETYLSPSVAACVVDEAIHGSPGCGGTDRMPTPREREVLQLVAEGKSSKEIAAILRISVPTVETHRRQLMARLDLHTVADLTKYAIREGLTTAEG